MMKINFKKLFIMSITVLTMFFVSNYSFGADTITIVPNSGSPTSPDVANPQPTNSAIVLTNNPSTTSSPVVSAPPLSNYTTQTPSSGSTLPKTGENDVYIVSGLLVVFAIFAVYAYRKIRDYNNM